VMGWVGGQVLVLTRGVMLCCVTVGMLCCEPTVIGPIVNCGAAPPNGVKLPPVIGVKVWIGVKVPGLAGVMVWIGVKVPGLAGVKVGRGWWGDTAGVEGDG